MKEAINQSYFNLVAKTVESCFLKTKGKEAINRKFANSALLKTFCDASQNFEYKKLRKLILKANI